MPEVKWIGGNHIKEDNLPDVVELLRSNRTILVLPMNDDANESSELVKCDTIGEAFQKFTPKAEVEVKTPDGSTTSREVRFGKIVDFAAESVVKAVPELRAQRDELAALSDLRAQLRDNANLRKHVDDDAKRADLIRALQGALRLLGGEATGGVRG